MDMRRLIRRGAQPVDPASALGYATLVATLAAAQGGGRTGRTAAGIDPASEEGDPVEALAQLLDPADRRRVGGIVSHGSFHPGVAGEITGKTS